MSQVAIAAGVTIAAGGITLSAGGSVKGGQTAYNTGTGFFLGYSGGAYKFSIGSASQYITWDGTTMTLKGSLDFADVTGATKPSNNADVTLTAVNGGLAVTGGGITLTAGGAVKGGQTAYATGTGFFLGYESAAYKFSIGSSTSYMRWTGAALEMAATISAGGITLNAGGDIKGGQTAYDTGTGFFLGYSGAAYKFSIGNASGKKLTWDGADLTIKGNITGISSIDITGSAKFGGSTSDSIEGDTVAVLANESMSLPIGIRGYAGTTGGLYGVAGIANSSSSGSAGVYGKAGSGTYGAIFVTTSTSSTSAAVKAVGHEITGNGVGLNLIGSLSWRTGGTGGTYRTWTYPDGNGNKVLAADGSWLNVGTALKFISSGHTTANGGAVGLPAGAAGFMILDTISGAGQVKMAYYVSP